MSAVEPIVGVYEPGVPGSTRLLTNFTTVTGVKPQIIVYYSAWYERFQTSFATQVHRYGATPLVQLQPNGVRLADITRGRYDRYLRTYATAVRSFGYPVLLSFGHEMNGTWYSWGSGHVAPEEFRAAWRHVVKIFRTAGATNIKWLWTINSFNIASSSIQQWWPGSLYVNWVGIDGYYYGPSNTFNSVFGTVVSQVRRITHDPILISETAVAPAAGEAKVTGIFNGVRSDHLLGLVWFDEAQHNGILHQDWRLENDLADLAAFRRAAAAFET